MKIIDIVSLTQEKPLNEIAKEKLEIGEKPTREALKKAGAKPQRGKRGWIFEGPEENLEKSIYDFAEVKARGVRANARTNETKKQNTIEVKKEDVLEGSNKDTKDETNKRKRASFDIDKELLKRLKVASVMEEKNVYEMVEEAIREYLDKKNK